MSNGEPKNSATRRDFITSAATFAASAGIVPVARAASGSMNEEPKAPAAAKGVTVKRLSWAGLRFSYGASDLFVDPWTSVDIWDGMWKDKVIPVESSAETKAVAITHLHNDHFDPKAAKDAIGASGRILCHRNAAPAVAAKGFEARGLGTWQPYLLANEFTIIPVPAEDGLAEFQVGWVVRAGQKSFFHGGDGIWHGHWHHIAGAYGPFEAIFLPINGVDLLIRQPLSHIPVSLLPEQAIAAAEVLSAKVVVPIHYGITDPAYYIETPRAIARFTSEAIRRGINTRVLLPGESYVW